MTDSKNALLTKARPLIREPERIRKCVSRVMGFSYEKMKREPAYRFLAAILNGGTEPEGEEPFVKDLGELILKIADYDPDNSNVYNLFQGDGDSELRISIVLMQALLRLIKSLSSRNAEIELLGYVSVRSLLEFYFIDPHITADDMLGNMNRFLGIPEEPSVKETVRACLYSIQAGWDFLGDSLEDYRQKKNLLCSSIIHIFVSALINVAGKEI